MPITQHEDKTPDAAFQPGEAADAGLSQGEVPGVGDEEPEDETTSEDVQTSPGAGIAVVIGLLLLGGIAYGSIRK